MVRFASYRQIAGDGISSPVFSILFTVLAVFFSSVLDARSASFYISPGGSDGDSGTSSSSAWKTFNYAIPKLRPGDTLILLDGTYNERLFIDCSRNASNGTEQSPITVKAQNERRAFIQGNGVDPPIQLQNCSYWVIEGIRAESRDNPNVNGGAKGHVFSISNSSDIVLKRLLGAYTNRYSNTHVYAVGSSSNILIEESEAYYFHRHGFSIYRSSFVTLRRNYANSRGYTDLTDGYRSIIPQRGDEGFVFYGATDSIMENNISEGNYYIGDYGSRNTVLGNISLNNNIGFAFSHHCCFDIKSADNAYINNVAIGSIRVGFVIQSQENTLIANSTSMDNKYDGFQANNKYSKWNVEPSITIRNSLAVDNDDGFKIADSEDFTDKTVEYLDALNKDDDYGIGISMNSTLKTLDPKLNGCKVYIPSTSPLKKAGKNGADIGANVVYRYKDGVLTNEKLWNQSTGQFPCGATIKGINDDATFPDSACVNVHERLNVGVNGCPIP
jgi:hypothetical protein